MSTLVERLSAECPPRGAAGEHREDDAGDGDARLGRPDRSDLGRSDAEEQERRAPDRPEVDEQGDVGRRDG
jgi:hypothetical protein